MDLDLLSKILRELVLIHNRVSLPGMGSFIAEKAPSVFSDRAMVIHPPFRRILFRPSEIWNDELLETRYAQEKGYKIEVAKHEIAEFIKRFKVDLNTNKNYRIPDFGTMRATEQSDYFFVADKNLFNYLEAFGLEPVNIKFLPRKGEIELLSGKAMPNFFKTDIRSIQNSTCSFDEEAAIVQEEAAVVTQEQPMQAEPLIPLGGLDSNMPPMVVPLPVSIGQPILKKPADQPQQIKEKSSNSKFIKSVVITLVIFFLIILVIALLVLFKEELKPFWEWLLYNKEERELLRSSLSSLL